MSIHTPKRLFLKDQAYEMIKELLMNGELTPGEFITEGNLCDRLEMSRTPIRSALQHLEHDGIVRIHPKQGIYICDISVKQVNEVYEIRIALETFALRKLSQGIEKHQIEELYEILNQQYENIKKEDSSSALEYDFMFHIKIMEFNKNGQMFEMFKSIRDKLEFYGKEVLKKKMDRLMQTYDEHLLVVAALEKGNTEEAVRHMEEHLQHGRKTLLDS